MTLGTGLAHGRDFYRAAAAACQGLGRRAVLLTRFSAVPTDLPPTVLHVPFAPLSLVAPRCAALVHHGGIGTTAAGLAAGLPQVVMPMSHDQPDNAHRAERLGIARAIRAGAYRAGRAAAALGALLEDPGVNRRAEDVASIVRSEDGVTAACDEIERALATG